jgi:hypothetical protein
MAIKICNFANFYACEIWSNTLQVIEQSVRENMRTMRVVCNERWVCLDSKLQMSMGGNQNCFLHSYQMTESGDSTSKQ